MYKIFHFHTNTVQSLMDKIIINLHNHEVYLEYTFNHFTFLLPFIITFCLKAVDHRLKKGPSIMVEKK